MWHGFSGVDERAAFKRTANGYVFRAPSRWLIGRAQHYLVDETQKEEIAAALANIQVQRAHATIVLVAAVLAGLLISTYFREHLMLAAACGFALLVAFLAVTRFQQFSALERLEAHLPHTAERITWHDRLRTASAATSFTHLILLALSFTVLSVAKTLELVELLARTGGEVRSLEFVGTACLVVLFTSIVTADLVVVCLKLRNRANGK